MGQQQSLTARAMGSPGLISTADSNLNNASSSHHHNQDSANSLNSGNGANNSSDIQTQSVRAAIDTFIESCLAVGSDRPSTPCRESAMERLWKNSELLTAPAEDNIDNKADCRKDVVPNSSEDTSGKELENSRDSKITPNKAVVNVAEKSSPTAPVCVAIHSNAQKDVKSSEGSSTSEGRSSCAQNLEEVSNSKENDSGSTSSVKKANLVSSANENSSDNLVYESSKSKDISDGSNDCDGMASVRLKTIIDRVLDSSLGVGMDLKSIPLEQRILPQIAADERANSAAAAAATKAKETESSNLGEAENNKHTNNSSFDKKVEPVKVCFMEHIEKAVERSFSSITEEEERREKEKALAARVSENTGANWNLHGSKSSEATPVAEATVSVQDIVDQVITQTEVITKLMTTSSAASKQVESKPLVSASGTFYPDRVPVNENDNLHNHYRRDAHKEDPPRETTGRRGRSRMRSPYQDHRESSTKEYLHGNSAREVAAPRHGSGGISSEEYLQSMHAVMAKYSQVHSTHGMPPFISSGMASNVSVTQGYPPVSSVHNAMIVAPAGLHHGSVSSLQAQTGRGSATCHTSATTPHHTSVTSHQTASTAPHYSSLSNQPPPLLRVNPMDMPGRLQQQPKHVQSQHHSPSKSCGCSTCAVYFAREHDAERVRMMQQPGQGERSLPRLSPHSPHHMYSKTTHVSHSHSERWPSVDPRHAETKQDKAHPQLQYTAYAAQTFSRGQDAYPANHQAYGNQTGISVPPLAYAEKHISDTRLSDVHYTKQPERGEYTHAQRHSLPLYEKAAVGEVTAGRYQHPSNMGSMKLISGQSQPHPNTYAHVPGRKVDDPVLDLTFRRDMAAPTSVPAFGEEDKPLDLSSKKQSSPASFSERQDARHRSEDGHQYCSGGMHVDTHGRGAGGLDRRREGDRIMSGSQHLHNLETSVESYFQKLQQHHGTHRLPPPPNISAGVPPQSTNTGVLPHINSAQPSHGISAGVPLHSISAGGPHGISTALPSHNVHAVVPHQNISAAVPPQNFSAGVPPHNISAGVPHHNVNAGLPPTVGNHASPVPPLHHQPVLTSQHRSPAGHQGYNSTSHPSPAGPGEPLLSPGGRRPQLHPIPAPNLSTSLVPTAPSSTASFPSRGGITTVSKASVVPTCSLPSPVTAVSNATPSVPVSSPQTNSGGGTTYSNEYLHSSGSRSVSPPAGCDLKGEDRRRGSVSKHEPIQNIIGNNNPQDILYLICRLCRQTYGSPYGFRKHFRNQHGFEPKAEHTLVQTISATKNARQMSGAETPNQETDISAHESYLPSGNPSADRIVSPPHTASPQPEALPCMASESPCSRNSESPGDSHTSEHPLSLQGSKLRGSFSGTSMDTKQRSPSSCSLAGPVPDEREDTKCLECPECGQAFQLNDFGSYKRHCRQHGQMRGVQAGVSQGTYACTDCQCSFPEAHLLQEHLLRHQPHAAAVQCTVCHVSFPSPAHCQEHVRTAHTGVNEPTSSSSPLTVGTKPKTTCSAFSHSDISSTSSIKCEISSAASADSSISFNLTVTTPSDLEIKRLPADHIVTSASPDSSSDNKKGQEGSPVSSSEQIKAETGKVEPHSQDSPKPLFSDGADTLKVKLENRIVVKNEDDKDSGFLDGYPSNDSRSISTDGSLASPVEMDDNSDLFMYKHKKFSAHRKRAGSNDIVDADVKQARLEIVKRSIEKNQQHIVSLASDKLQYKKPALGSQIETGEEKPAPTKLGPPKTEARHQMPVVWDRVTRSQAGKNARSTDYP